MLPQFTRAGNAARSLHTSTYLLGVIVLLLVTILLSSWRGSTDGYTQAITQSLGNTPSAGGSASTSHLYPRVVITGDSIAVKSFDYGESFGSKLAKMFAGKMDVLNRGFTGYNTRQLLKRFREGRFAERPGQGDTKLFVLSIGTSDSAISGQQRVEPDEFKQNVKSILEHIKRFHPTARVMLMTPSTVHVERWTKHMPELNKPEPGRGSLAALNTPDREVATNKRYSGFLKNIVLQWNRDNAAEHKVALVEAFRLHALAKGQQGVLNEQLFVDGLHWSAKAHEIVTRRVLEHFDSTLSDLAPANLQDPYEHWSEYEA